MLQRRNEHDSMRDHEYVYTNLAPHWIRVFSIDVMNDGEPLQYSLHEVALSSKQRPVFMALSYACGDTTQRVSSYCNGARLDIYKTLDVALRGVSRYTKNRPRIWADAICINQKDNLEKASQVAKMWQIYQWSSQIYVWLGPELSNDDTRRALLTMESKMLHPKYLADAHRDHKATTELIQSQTPVYLEVDEYLAIMSFFNSNWFQRLWTVQEVCLWTDASPYFVLGECIIPWDVVYHSLGRLTRCQIRTPITLRNNRMFFRFMTGGSRGSARLVYSYHVQKGGPESSSQRLHQILVNAWSLKSFDPRDKIYGLLGLVRNHYEITHDTGESSLQKWKNATRSERVIRIDYNQPFEIIYENVARVILQEESSLVLLTRAGTGRRDIFTVSLPSWVPDWSKSPNCTDLVDLGDDVQPRPSYFASKDAKASFDDRRSQGLLDVSASFQDTIAFCASSQFGNHLSDGGGRNFRSAESNIVGIPGIRNYLMSLWRCFGCRFKDYPTLESPFDVFWRTLISNRIHDIRTVIRPGDHVRDSFVEALKGYTESSHGGEHECVCGSLLTALHSITNLKTGEELASSLHISQSLSSAYEGARPNSISDSNPSSAPTTGQISETRNTSLASTVFIRSVEHACAARRFFITQRGYMGIGPRNIQEGDRVVILKGGPLPFILRRGSSDPPETPEVYKEQFELIGESYIHGLSDGEGIAHMRNPDDKSEWKSIYLR